MLYEGRAQYARPGVLGLSTQPRGRLKQKDCEFKASLGYIASSNSPWATYRELFFKKCQEEKGLGYSSLVGVA